MNTIEQKVRTCYESAPFPDSLRVAKNFNKELARITTWIRLNLNFLSEDLINIPPKKILCAGCGTGEEAIALAKIFPQSAIVAIDISVASLEIAKKNIKRASIKNIILRNLSIIKGLPRIKKRYDFIYSSGVIHHLEKPRLGFGVLANKLTRGGSMVIMLYNSWGLFFYRLQLLILNILGGDDSGKRMFWIKAFGLAKDKNKVLIYDSYINPQIKTFSIEEVKSWADDEKLSLAAIVPPLNIKALIEYASRGKKYFFRRKGLLNLVLSFTKLIFRTKHKEDKFTPAKFHPIRTFAFQLVFLLLGKGECQYLLQKRDFLFKYRN